MKSMLARFTEEVLADSTQPNNLNMALYAMLSGGGYGKSLNLFVNEDDILCRHAKFSSHTRSDVEKNPYKYMT